MRDPLSSALCFVVHTLNISNKAALQLLLDKKVLINGVPASVKQQISLEDEIEYMGVLLKQKEEKRYLLYHKPRGIETTLNRSIPDNLADALAPIEGVFPVGRLDKDSEGLLLLTNDGRLYNKITKSEHKQEKEYEVAVNKPITDDFILQMSTGVTIMGTTTLSAKVWKINDTTFRIVLVQGLNRQIRRMCYKLGYGIDRLKRTRIVHLELAELPIGQWRELRESELELLLQL